MASGKLTYLETPEHEVEAVTASPKGRWLAWLVNVGRQVGAEAARPEDAARRVTPPGLPLGVVAALEFAPDDSKLAFVFDGPRHNPDVWVWDLEPTTASCGS